MSQLSALKSADTLHDVASLLGYKPSRLSYILYIKQEDAKYTTFSIPKKSGGSRTISAPIDELKVLQRKLADLLQNCIDEINRAQDRHDEGSKPDRIAHGFKRGRSIVTNAKWHRNKRYVLNIDIEDFFGSISGGRIRNFFIADANFLLKPKVATILAQIACHKGALPQGSPCSPVISNLIGQILDIKLVKLVGRLGCTYTRYADDISISTNLKEFPPQIAASSEDGWAVGKSLSDAISQARFRINHTKTRMQFRDSRQEVTGLVVNKKINVKSTYRRAVRAMVDNLLKTGEFYLSRGGPARSIDGPEIVGRLDQLHGRLGFIDAIDQYNLQGDSERQSAGGVQKLYRRFLLYKEFYATQIPVVVCEGKTDNVYLTHAIRQLVDKFPTLAARQSDGKIGISFKRFRYSGTSTGRILGINGGTSELATFIQTYRQESLRFTAPGMTAPVIILIDNDLGASPILGIVKHITGQRPTRHEDFIHVVKNLYVCFTPLNGGQESKIEDLFREEVLARTINGRHFDASNNYDPRTHYGKSDFAYKVVEPHAESIDFSHFEMIFQRFADILEDHKRRLVISI